jgi:2-polyprenyl-3-methyl-5-hydroxy-6-metoxy-1,4-benzoquinol methylase
VLGAEVTAVDKDPALLEAGRQAARELGVAITWVDWDLEKSLPPLGTFDVLLIFNYLDRARLPDILSFIRPDGLLLMETFLEDQLNFDWGPRSPARLLRRGELAELVAPLKVLHGREALEPHEGVRWSAVASVLARKVS